MKLDIKIRTALIGIFGGLIGGISSSYLTKNREIETRLYENKIDQYVSLVSDIESVLENPVYIKERNVVEKIMNKIGDQKDKGYFGSPLLRDGESENFDYIVQNYTGLTQDEIDIINSCVGKIGSVCSDNQKVNLTIDSINLSLLEKKAQIIPDTLSSIYISYSFFIPNAILLDLKEVSKSSREHIEEVHMQFCTNKIESTLEDCKSRDGYVDILKKDIYEILKKDINSHYSNRFFKFK